MGKVKSDCRSCLSVDILNCLMRINIEGLCVAEFVPQPGLQMWWASGIEKGEGVGGEGGTRNIILLLLLETDPTKYVGKYLEF